MLFGKLKPIVSSAKLRPWRWLENMDHSVEEDESPVCLKRIHVFKGNESSG